MRRDLAGANALLHGFGKLFHQSQSARDPAHAAIESPRQFLQAIAETSSQFLKQPSFFQRGFRFGKTHRSLQHQRIRFIHVPNDGFHRVAAQLFQSGYALVAIDDLIAIWFVRYGNNHDRRLLSRCRQRRQQPPLPLGIPNAQMLITSVELMELQLHSAFPLRPSTLVQFVSGIAWPWREVCPQALNLQSHKPRTGIARSAGELRPKSQ